MHGNPKPNQPKPCTTSYTMLLVVPGKTSVRRDKVRLFAPRHIFGGPNSAVKSSGRPWQAEGSSASMASLQLGSMQAFTLAACKHSLGKDANPYLGGCKPLLGSMEALFWEACNYSFTWGACKPLLRNDANLYLGSMPAFFLESCQPLLWKHGSLHF